MMGILDPFSLFTGVGLSLGSVGVGDSLDTVGDGVMAGSGEEVGVRGVWRVY